MRFIELVLQNFGPYVGRQVIDFRPKENEEVARPIILFGGMNGGGKTTLMDAIRLALYGNRAQCSTRGNLSYSDFLTQCVNRHTPSSEKARIELVFEVVKDKKLTQLRVVRYWSNPPKDGKDSLGVIVNEEWKDEALSNTWDEYIENILPIGISNLFLFDGEQVKELAEQETPPQVVIEAIQSLLGLELAERLAVDIEILVSRKRKQLANANQKADLEVIEKKLTQQRDEYDAALQKLAAIQNEVEKAAKKFHEASDKYVAEGGKIAAESTQLNARLKNAENNAAAQRQALCELAAGTLPLALIQPLLSDAETQGKKEYRWQQARMARDVLIERDRRLLDYLTQLKLTDSKVNKIEEFLNRENQTLEQEIGSEAESWLGADEETLKAIAQFLEYDFPNQKKQAQDLLSNLEESELQQSNLERQLAIAAPQEVYEQLDKAVKDAQKHLIQMKADYELAERKSKEIERAINQTKKELEKYSDRTIELKNAAHIIKASERVQQTLKLFKEKLTEKKITKLEQELTQCFGYLLHKSDLVHRVVIQTKDFSLAIYDKEGKNVPKHRLSAGEKQMLAIAFLWGLARVSGRSLPVAIDTPLGRLDSSHRQNLVDRYFPAASHQVILLSTDTEIGKAEIERLREMDAIAHEYLLQYDSAKRQTTVETGYFW